MSKFMIVPLLMLSLMFGYLFYNPPCCPQSYVGGFGVDYDLTVQPNTGMIVGSYVHPPTPLTGLGMPNV